MLDAKQYAYAKKIFMATVIKTVEFYKTFKNNKEAVQRIKALKKEIRILYKQFDKKIFLFKNRIRFFLFYIWPKTTSWVYWK